MRLMVALAMYARLLRVERNCNGRGHIHHTKMKMIAGSFHALNVVIDVASALY